MVAILGSGMVFEKDHKPSEESRKKMSESQKKRMSNLKERRRFLEVRITTGHKGKKHSEESKKKMSEALKGKIPWIKGKHHTTETLLKMGLIHKGQVPWNNGLTKDTDAIVKAYGEKNKGKIRSAEARKNISESHKGKPTWNKGKTGIYSEETKRKMGEANLGKIAWNKGKLHSSAKNLPQAFKKGHKTWNKGKRPAEETIKKQIETFRKTFSNPESRKKIIEQSRANILKMFEFGTFPNVQNTKPERQIKEELIKRGYVEGEDFIHQYKFMNKFMCDFCFPKQKIVVEVYGDFWHANPKKYPASSHLHPHQLKGLGRDKSKQAYITAVDNRTWTYIALWESDIKKNVAKCVDVIEEVLAEKKHSEKY